LISGAENTMMKKRVFDECPEKYDQWFTTPIGKLIKEYETQVIIELLRPRNKESILDAGCGTGIFTLDILTLGARVFGLDISLPMLMRAGQKAKGYPFHGVIGNMMNLPFADCAFDKVISVTALEFIKDAKGAINELFRVTKQGGCLVVATLNSLSPWAARRKSRAEKGQSPLFEKAIFRSPDEIMSSMPVDGIITTAIHFQKDVSPETAKKIEQQGKLKGLNTGAFLASRWEKPN
jgi:ubiquinone/menaquinone biosynthesis C-methylase UbiE